MMDSMQLSKNSSVRTSPYGNAKHDEIPCTAYRKPWGIEFNFQIQRRHPQDLWLCLDMTDLRAILFNIADNTPQASILFAECVTKAIAADAKRIATLAPATDK